VSFGTPNAPLPIPVLPHRLLEQVLRDAVAECLPDAKAAEILVRPCADSRFGDYQTSALMALAKERKLNPRQLAATVASKLKLPGWVRKMEIAGAGFLNFHLDSVILGEVLKAASLGHHLFYERTQQPRTVVIDFSAPNVAKPMHVGHIRSTILGDCLARIQRCLGHRVITDNHIGDWGTQFGKLLIGWKRYLDQGALKSDPIAELERLYQLVNQACDQEPAILESARHELVKLQSGDTENLTIWREMIALSQRQFDAIYSRLGVRFDYALGESFYNDRLKSVVADLQAAGMASASEGAIVAFFDDIPELKAHPALIQKSDGAANYTTTDLATLQYRIETWRPDEIIYVTDGRQQLHFRQLFAIFRRWQPAVPTKLIHVWFGTILGEDGKPFKTRSGGTIKLADLLDEAESRAFQVISEKNPELDENLRREIARVVGLGAVKYADLLPNRQSDYAFSWEKILALNGNTAPYLLYAYARIQSIFRKLDPVESAQRLSAQTSGPEFTLSVPDEITLAKHLINFGLVLDAVLEEHRPNFLCNYLYDLAGHFARFYEHCPVLKATGHERVTRLALCELTSLVLKKGLELLGIETLEKM
jgi:arginyl-tRNA synthetase